MTITLNGTERTLDDLLVNPTVTDFVLSLGFRPDRVALEQNGNIVPRSAWSHACLVDGDRIELVHFVGGGSF